MGEGEGTKAGVAKTKFAKRGRISRVLSLHLSKRYGERELKKEEPTNGGEETVSQ